jgi:hypothetical protein
VRGTRAILVALPGLALAACAMSVPAVSIEATPASTVPPSPAAPTVQAATTAPTMAPAASAAPTVPPGVSAAATVPPRPPLAPEARVEVQTGAATGLAEAAQVVAALHPAYRRCFTTALQRDPGLTGKVGLEVKIDAGGKVAAVKLQDEVGLDLELAACMVGATRAARFPPSASGTTLRIPIKVVPSPP